MQHRINTFKYDYNNQSVCPIRFILQGLGIATPMGNRFLVP